MRKTQAEAAGSEDEGRTMRQGMWAASGSWKKQGNGLPLVSRKHAALPTPWF